MSIDIYMEHTHTYTYIYIHVKHPQTPTVSISMQIASIHPKFSDNLFILPPSISICKKLLNFCHGVLEVYTSRILYNGTL